MNRTHSSAALRIAFLESTGRMGGAELVLMDLIRRFPQSQLEPYLVAPEPGELTLRAAQYHIPTLLVPLPPFASFSRVWGNRKILNPFAVVYDTGMIFAAAQSVVRALQPAQIDIIHTNTVFAHLYGGIAARRLGVPCVWHLHDAIETTRFGGLAGWVWRCLGNRLATRIVGSSRCAVRAFANNPKAMTIYNGIEPLTHPSDGGGNWRAHLNLDAHSLLVGYVRRVDWSKGLDVLAEAARQVVISDPNVHFIIVGTSQFGDAGYAAAVDSQIRSFGLERNWHTVGYVEDAAQCLDDLNCLVLPSRRESFPRVLLEAGLVSSAVVATDVGGVSEIIESGVTGILVPPQDPKALAAALLHVLHTAAHAHSLGAALHDRVLDKFDVQTSVNRFMQLYARMADASAPLVRAQSSHQFRPD